MNQRQRLLSLVQKEWERVHDRYYKNQPIGLPVGGGDWLDSFIEMEGLRGFLSKYKDKNVSLEDAIKDGQTLIEIAVDIWNSHREWQVHRDKRSKCDAFALKIYHLVNLSRNSRDRLQAKIDGDLARWLKNKLKEKVDDEFTNMER